MSKSEAQETYIAGVGASAGGLESISEFLKQLNANTEKLAIIIAQHLSPTYKSRLVELLGRATELTVKEASDNSVIEAGTVYITPPDSDITIKDDRIFLNKPSSTIGPKPSVDTFFYSLAREKGHNAIGIILSGTGSDGASGIMEIKKMGGFTLAQEPETSKYSGMPIAAIETGDVDAVLAPASMADALSEYMNNPDNYPSHGKKVNIPINIFRRILNLLTDRTGTDFTNYKQSTIERRLEKRITQLNIRDLEDYYKYLQSEEKELDILFNNILIGVTSFFRDQDAFDELKSHLEDLISNKSQDRPIRIWVPGCASGEEAYTIAIIISELIRGKYSHFDVQIFATDIDEKAINHARKGVYPESSFENVPDVVVQKYFVKRDNYYELVKSIRGMVLFSKHDVTNNPPFLKLDLISCRNLLIYFGSGLQKQVIPIFHYALNPQAILFLGKSETVGQFTDLFSTIDAKNKIFQRKLGGGIHSVKFSRFRPQKTLSSRENRPNTPKAELSLNDMLKETFYNAFDHPYVVVNDSLDIIHISGNVKPYLGFTPGSMTANILKQSHKDLTIELRTTISRAIKDRKTVTSKIRKIVNAHGELSRLVKVIVKPVQYTSQSEELFVVIFEELEPNQPIFVTQEIASTDPESVRVIELEQELLATKEHLQSFVEELETSNEELQSLNEELQSTNEELQSSNEELETSNEELQSTNEEIQIAYAELKSAHENLEMKDLQLSESRANINALLQNTLQIFILIDTNYKVMAFNDVSHRLNGNLFVKTIKEGMNFMDLLDESYLSAFRKRFHTVLKGQSVEHEISINLQKTRCWYLVNMSPVFDEQTSKVNAISLGILDVTKEKTAQQELAEQHKLITAVFNSTDIGICVTDDEGRFVAVNQGYCELYGYDRDELMGQHFSLVVPGSNKEKASKMHDEFIESGKEIPGEWTVVNKKGKELSIFVSAQLIEYDDGQKFKVTTIRKIDK